MCMTMIYHLLVCVICQFCAKPQSILVESDLHRSLKEISD